MKRIFANTRRRARHGFTLVEIIVVMLIIAIVAAAVMPNLEGAVDDSRLDAAAARIGDLMEQCQRASVATRQVYGLMFERDGVHYYLATAPPVGQFERDEEAGGPASQLQRLTPPDAPNTALPEGVRLANANFFETKLTQDEGGGVRVLFFPDGSSEFATLKLVNMRGAQRSIDLNGLSGSIDIATPQPGEQAGG